MSLLVDGAAVPGLIRKTAESTTARIPSKPDRAQPKAAISRIDATTGAKYLGTKAGLACEAIQATARVTSPRAISVHSAVASGVRRSRRVNRGQQPTTQAENRTRVTRSPPSTWREISTGAPNRG